MSFMNTTTSTPLRTLMTILGCGVFLAGCALLDPDEDKPDETDTTSTEDNAGAVASNDEEAFQAPDMNNQGKTRSPNPNTVVSANPTGCSGEGETFSSERGRCYRFVPQPALSWSNAAIDCSLWSAGRGHLVAVTSQEEDDFIHSFSSGGLWLGGSDAKSEGGWGWLSQEVWSFQNFELGRPDNVGGVEHCLSKQQSGLWNDLPCEVQLPYMCERSIQ
jgi:hypothetical protein